MATPGSDGLRLLVADGDEGFAQDVVDTLVDVGESVSADAVTSGKVAVKRSVASGSSDVDAVLVGDQLDSLLDTVEALATASVPVLLLTDAQDDRTTIAAALEAGASDYYSRITAAPQYDVILDRISGELDHRSPIRGESREIFDTVTDAITVHDPHDEEIEEINEAMVDLIGTDRDSILDGGVSAISATDEGYTAARAYQIMRRVLENDEAETHKWLLETADGDRRWVEANIAPARIGGERRTLIVSRDITERERRAREFEEIFNGVIDPIAVYDPETLDVLDANEAFLDDLIEDDLRAVRERGVAEYMATEEGFTVERAREIHQRVAETGEPETVDWKGRTKEGEDLWLEVRITPAVIGGEEVTIASHRDVTERKRRVREFEQMFNSVTDAIGVFDPETYELIRVNDRLPELTGYDREAILGDDLVLSVGEEGYDKEYLKEVVDDVIESGDSREVDWLFETAQGDRLLVEVNATPATINGEPRYLAIMRDVTEKRRTERRLSAVVDRIDEAIYLGPADEITNPSIQSDDLSAGYEEIWGQSLEDIFENNDEGILATVHPEDRDRFATFVEGIEADVAAGTADDRYSQEFRIQRPAGSVRWVRSDFYPTDWGPGASRMVVVSRDVTERREREQRIASFHEATRELTAVDSREVACQLAVEAADNVLGFPVVSAHLYDEGQGELVPVAASSPQAEAANLPSFAPGDSLPWQVFVEGESATSTDPVTELSEMGHHSPDLVLSLGNHGVMLVRVPDSSFDAEEVDLAQALAATLEAALNHVAGERALEEREQELRHHQRRAERLEQLNAFIRDIERATVEESSRAGIEKAVCDRLIDVDLHDLVWVAEPTAREDGLVVGTSAGSKETYLDAMSMTLDAGAGNHPSVRAFRNDETQAVGSVASDVTGDWRKTALRHGIQSVVAVPVSYENRNHGVLTVASTEPGAFDNSTQDVLAELGRSIGYAITVAERERALESEGTTELELAARDEGLFMIRASDETNCQVRLERTIRRTGGSFSTFYVVERADPSELIDIAEAAQSVETAQVVSVDEDDETGLIEVCRSNWFGSVFTDYGAVVREATADGGTGTLVVETPREADVRSLLKGFQSRYPDTELVAQRQRERTIPSLFELQDLVREELTDRQWEAFETAYSAGYFAWPRESSGQDVADMLGVTQPTFNKHVRLAEQTAVEVIMERGYPGSD